MRIPFFISIFALSLVRMVFCIPTPVCNVNSRSRKFTKLPYFLAKDKSSGMYADEDGNVHFEIISRDLTQSHLVYSMHGNKIQEMHIITPRNGRVIKYPLATASRFKHVYEDKARIEHTIIQTRVDHLIKSTWIKRPRRGPPSIRHYIDGKYVSDVEESTKQQSSGEGFDSLTYTHKLTGKHDVQQSTAEDGTKTSVHRINGNIVHQYKYQKDEHGNQHVRHDHFATTTDGHEGHITRLWTNGKHKGSIITSGAGTNHATTHAYNANGEQVEGKLDSTHHDQRWEAITHGGAGQTQHG